MKKNKLLIAGLVWMCFFMQIAQAKSRPNLILIVTDEHNFRTLGAYRDIMPREQGYLWGDTVVETPHLDDLAKNGVLFSSMYAAMPVCTPARSTMFTGNYPHVNGNEKNDTVMHQHIPTIADVLTDAGYMTGYVGKWHLSGKAKPGWAPEYKYGFQDNRYMFNRGHWKKFGLKGGGIPFVAQGKPDKETFATDWLTDRALDFIGEHKDKPFFYVISYPDPHTPNSVRAPYNTMFKDAEIRMPSTFNKKMPAGSPAWQLDDKKSAGEMHKMESMVRQYFGMVKCIDDNIGRLVNKLKAEGILDNTMIVFSSDHGDMLGEHHRINKGAPQEGSSRIPFIMYYPKALPKGKVIHQAANTADWMDTFMSIMKVKGYDPKTTQGRDLSPLMSRRVRGWDDVSIIRMGGWVGAFSDRYKLILETSKKGSGKPWLIDLEKDPDELTNHIDDPKNAKVVKTLANAMIAHGQRTQDPGVLSRGIQSQLKRLLR